MPLELSFLILPIVLHRATRDELPVSTKTSLAVWLQHQPFASSQIADRARRLVPHTREALTFGGLHGLLAFDALRVIPQQEWRLKVRRSLRQCGEEVNTCAHKAEFVGKWFATAGEPTTVMALIGVRP